MRKVITVLTTLCLICFLAVPALADVNLHINGQDYEPVTLPQIEDGRTLAPLYVVERVLGADVTTAGQDVTIANNQQTLAFTVGSTVALLDGEEIGLPLPPRIENGEIMVPLRAVMDAFGATIGWQEQTRTVSIDYREQRQNMSVEEMLTKSTEAFAQYNTYKMKVDMDQQMEVNIPEMNEEETIDMNMTMDMALQNEPLLLYGKIQADALAPGLDSSVQEIEESEMLFNEEGMFMTMPGEGWVKFNIPGMDMKAILKQAGTQDPMSSLKQLQDTGVIMSFGNDRQKDDQSYWVINVTMGIDSMRSLIQDALDTVPLTESGIPELDEIMEQLFKDMEADIYYSAWINQDNFITDYMELESDINIKLEIPAVEGQSDMPESMEMKMKQNALYEVYDLGATFTVPDVSGAKDFTEFMQESLESMEIENEIEDME